MPIEITGGNVAAEEIGHLIIPGRGRAANGMEISPSGLDRVMTAIDFYKDRGGLIKRRVAVGQDSGCTWNGWS